MTPEGNDKVRLQFLPFDTDIFGFACGELMIEDEALSEKDIHHCLQDAYGQNMRHLCVKIPAEWVNVGNILEGCGFLLRMCSLDLGRPLSTGQNESREDGTEIFDGCQVEQLLEITERAFARGTRFHFEPAFAEEQVKNLHRQWIGNLLRDDDVILLVVKEEGEIAGYISVKIDTRTRRGHIGLFAVHPGRRNKGLGSKLLRGAVFHAAKQADAIHARTECINYPALNVYKRNGFSITRSWYVFHRFA